MWGACPIDNEDGFVYGSDIDSFLEFCKDKNIKGWYHNLKFDIQFIYYWLFKNGYIHTTRREVEEGKFSTLISNMGLFYTTEIHFREGGVLMLYDSLKLISMPLREFNKALDLGMDKLEIDYNAKREPGYQATEQEIEYLRHDCIVLRRGLVKFWEAGEVKMTAASNAINTLRDMYGKDKFSEDFPCLSIGEDRDIRRSYKGGWTYLNPKYQDIDIGSGLVYDVNSMYPWAMRDTVLPYGYPEYYEGEYVQDEQFPLYIQVLSCRFKLKPDKYPSIQIKGSFRFLETEYLTESGDDPVLLTLTNVDLELFKFCYDIYDIQYICGYKFQGRAGMFREYIDYWYAKKVQYKKEGNLAMCLVAKLKLNSAYGKFGSNPIKISKYPWYDKENDIVRYSQLQPEEGKGIYCPVASYITSYARDKIIRTAIACGDRFIYADTDSVHIIGTDEPDIDIDNYRLGAFKLEGQFTRAKYHRAKCYIEEIDGKLDKKCAGLPKEARGEFNFETMHSGAVFGGKLQHKVISGGAILVEKDFTLK